MADLQDSCVSMMEEDSPAEASNTPPESDSRTQNSDLHPEHAPSSFESSQFSNNDEAGEAEAHSRSAYVYNDLASDQNVERQIPHGNVGAWWQAPVKLRSLSNGCHSVLDSHGLKLQKYDTYRDVRAAPTHKCIKLWSRKPKSGNGVSLNTRILQKLEINQPDENRNHEVLTPGHSDIEEEGNILTKTEHNPLIEQQMKKKNYGSENPMRQESSHCGRNRQIVKFWRPVNQQETRGPTVAQNGHTGTEVNEVAVSGDKSQSNYPGSRAMDIRNGCTGSCYPFLPEKNLKPGSSLFSNHDTRAFLARRWDKAMACDHVKLILSDDNSVPQ